MADIIAALINQVEQAYQSQQPLEIVGGASKKFIGRQPVGEALNTAEHCGIISYEPVELVITARAGTRISELTAVLAENNQMLAFEPPCFSSSTTIGGTLACNQSGPARPWAGSIRDHVLGVRLINGRAEHLKFGGQVMKNVAGYDVSRLQAGAMGTLGVITEISLKVMPKPAAVATLVWEMPADEAIVLMSELSATAKPISAACWCQGKLYVRLSGTSSAVEATKKQWARAVKEDGDFFWQQLRDQQLAFFNRAAPLWRFSINPAAQIPRLDARSIIDWGGALRWYQGTEQQQDMEQLAGQAHGQVSLFAGGERKAEVLHSTPAPLRGIQKKLKESFDPKGILNPGRLYSWM
ncbi:MAG: glycolate oxidase subunit GlcE [Oceanospirillaceae bacterium]|nr:glycolate oxidase subunit GlcE [Oceanospirillaceae bacterium]